MKHVFQASAFAPVLKFSENEVSVVAFDSILATDFK